MLQGKGLCWVVFGRTYHWVISSISKQSTSTDVAILVNVIPAWQHTPRKQPSQTEYFFCFVHHRACNQLWNTDISGLTVHYTASVSEWSGKKRWRWNEHSINIQTIVFAQSTDGEPERCWSSGWCWSQHVTEMKKNTAEFPSLFPSPLLGGKVFTVTYDLWSNEWWEIGRGTYSIRTWWRDAMGREWRSGERPWGKWAVKLRRTKEGIME